MNSLWLWIGFNLFVLVLLALDLGLLHRRDKVVGIREALLLSLGYFVLALLFGAGVYHFLGADAGMEFFTGYLLEKSLSVDNIFVFVLVFSHFSVPPQYQHRVLFWGILGALVMRAALILTGATIIAAFHWVIYLFGAFLIFTGGKMLATINQEPDMEGNRLVRLVRRHFRVTEDYVGHSFFVRRDGLLYLTPLMVVLILVEVTDVVFALDSIPAIFAITTDPFIVYTSNVFAILGLRALYFALVGVIHRFHYLKYGLSLVLMVVGAKMLINAAFGKVIPTEAALLVTALLIGGSMLVSVVRTRRLPREAATTEAVQGWVPGSPARKEGGEGDSSGTGVE
ncbi:membrane protein [Desulfuromonas versatilis]|uniref:Membrane protein n=1 Tax=Desulfuromonas versatilis TaxID=2802975 RepID=A0ABM8HRU8_9BACT|nr:TerC family protein [Desulfuromonas versatilis]BCR03164.1 membrane protein [Desulfuromonas versatilis]